MSVFDEDLSYEEARAMKDHLAQLFEHPGWALVLDWLDNRASHRHRELTSMCPENMEQMVRFARIKGGIEELQLLPGALAQEQANLARFVREVQEIQDEEMETN